MRSDLTALKERIEKVDHSDRDLDADLMRALGADVSFFGSIGWRMRRLPWDKHASGHWQSLPRYTASLDASLALVERMLPEHTWRVEKIEDRYEAYIWDDPDENSVGFAGACSPALAIISALISALTAKEDENV